MNENFKSFIKNNKQQIMCIVGLLLLAIVGFILSLKQNFIFISWTLLCTSLIGFIMFKIFLFDKIRNENSTNKKENE